MAIISYSFLISIFILLIILIIFLSGIHILREWERAPVLTLGRFVGIKGPGIIYVIPFVSKIPVKISLRLQVYSFRTEQSLTKDNVPVDVDAVMYLMPVDVQKSVLNVENYAAATEYAAQTTLREVIGQTIFDELLSEREKIGAKAREIIDEKTESWGVKVTAVEIRDIKIPSALQEAMSRQAQAERERRARVTLALAEVQAAEKMVQAADLYKDNDRAFQLRWMNMLYEFGLQSKGTLIMIPTNIPPAGVAPLGIYNIEDVLKEKKKSENK
ncbi:MAG: slipin family protein [Nitrososphaerota archaeon]|jgi:regulator of protease activity HflC (stomatin/prohibitin superfamily)|nr:SPFH domain-containing protein [Nitrososphaerota archaeon]MDG6927512.1 slipin family protein [Nitrososphaerota archaeon]MDG6930898.1 slipin family protein [Nitrososphaerota archaeon]MDG6932445.1 slipin family protein [Nitrososphaerota archaeon]MDG6936055.1 slipin family protein [Nitrososphaerota archaeon]